MIGKELRVMQLIDSLDAGGAERVSVNLANALEQAGVKSYLCATRRGGALEQFVDSGVDLIILKKTKSFDLSALYKLYKFVKEEQISIIHAHSSSFFLAVQCKLLTGVKVFWHDHYGKAEALSERSYLSIRIASYLFDKVIVVNEKLAIWSKERLHVRSENIVFLQNFAQLLPQYTDMQLPGSHDKRIVCLANYRPQKDHINLLKAFKFLHEKYPEWHLLLVGLDQHDNYSQQIKNYINTEYLEEHVHLLGSRSDTADILFKSTIGVLSSESEGLPVALLEYGLAKLPVVCTDVGQCSDVLGAGEFGIVVPAKCSDALAKSLLTLIEDIELRKVLAKKFHSHVLKNYSQKSVMTQLVGLYQKALDE